MRICLDPRDLNKALLRPNYQLPTIDDVLPELANAKIFSVLDAKTGFWQIELDEESSRLTTFWTPYGRFRWRRLAFGLSPAPEEFQRRLHEIVCDLSGVVVIADDILVYGTGSSDEEALQDHDIKLKRLLDRARETNLKLNENKMKLRQTEVLFMGHVLSKNGLKPDTFKVKAVVDMKQPENPKDVQRFLGFVNYLAKFVPTLSDLCEPLRHLTKQDVPWVWDEVHSLAMEKIKQKITKAPVLKYFNVKEPVTVQCDASSTGLGATILQNNQPVAYASRTLTAVERRYAQIEKECLAILFACNRFRHFIGGKSDVTIHTDHQSLVSIFKKSLLCAPRRLQNMLLKLQRFNFELEYIKGTDMVLADTLSRAAISSDNEEMIEHYQIHQIKGENKALENVEKIDATEYLNVTSERLTQIKEHTLKDKHLQKLSKVIVLGWPTTKNNVGLDASVKEYWNFRDELVIHDGIIFRGNRLVVPKSLRQDLLKRIHSSHQGLDSSLRKARDALYWPHMSEEIKQTVESCTICVQNATNQPHMKMLTHETPDLPWKRVAVDVFTHNRRNFLVTVDFYSDYWELDELPDMRAQTLVEITKKNFSRWGIPRTLVSDNAPNFVSYEWRQFSKEWDFEHVTSSPYHARGNGKAEATVKIAKNILKKCLDEPGGDEKLWLAILEWRNTPSKNMDSSPVQRIMSRRTRSLVPMTRELLTPSVPFEVEEKINWKKNQYKKYYDTRAKHLPDLQVGQGVAVKPAPTSSSSKWNFGTVVEKSSPRSYKILTPTGLYRRNREWIKPSMAGPRHSFKSNSPRKKQSQSLEEQSEDYVNNQDNSSKEQGTEELPENNTRESPSVPQPTRTTRFGRLIKTPERYKH